MAIRAPQTFLPMDVAGEILLGDEVTLLVLVPNVLVAVARDTTAFLTRRLRRVGLFLARRRRAAASSNIIGSPISPALAFGHSFVNKVHGRTGSQDARQPQAVITTKNATASTTRTFSTRRVPRPMSRNGTASTTSPQKPKNSTPTISPST